MKVLSYIMGGILIIGGIICLFDPADTFLSTGYIMAIMFLVFGIIGIVNVILKRTPAISLLASIPATIIGIIAIVRPGTTLVFDAFMIYLFAAWYVLQGITTMIMAIQMKGRVRGWGFPLAIGIISIVLGIYTFVYPSIAVIAIGIMIGIFLIETGIDLIAITSIIGAAVDQLRHHDDEQKTE